MGAGVTATGSGATKTVTVGAGVSTLAALSDTTIASSAAGQTLLYDASDSYDNKQIKVMQDNSAFTTAFPTIDSSHIFRVTAVSGSNHYTFSNYNSDIYCLYSSISSFKFYSFYIKSYSLFTF